VRGAAECRSWVRLCQVNVRSPGVQSAQYAVRSTRCSGRDGGPRGRRAQCACQQTLGLRKNAETPGIAFAAGCADNGNGEPIGKVWRRNPDLAAYVIYGKTPPTKDTSLSGAGQFEIFLKVVGTRIGQPVIADEVELPDGIIGWSTCLDEPEKTDWREFPRQHAKNPSDVAKHVRAQIGYQFVKAKRTVPVLYLERAKK